MFQRQSRDCEIVVRWWNSSSTYGRNGIWTSILLLFFLTKKKEQDSYKLRCLKVHIHLHILTHLYMWIINRATDCKQRYQLKWKLWRAFVILAEMHRDQHECSIANGKYWTTWPFRDFSFIFFLILVYSFFLTEIMWRQKQHTYYLININRLPLCERWKTHEKKGKVCAITLKCFVINFLAS